MTLIFITLLTVLLFAYLAIPLLDLSLTGPLPDPRGPVTQDLQEEGDALLRAIP